MRILLIFPSRLDSNGQVIKYRKANLPPLSLATLASLTPKIHDVKIVNDIAEKINYDSTCDLVAISAMTSQSPRAYQIADEFRRRGRKVVLGGVHPTMMPNEAGQHADAVVVGEAENIWEEVLADCEAGSLRSQYCQNGYTDLNRKVIPRWDVANLSIYPHRIGSRLPMMPIFTTRGCPYGCRFCSVTKLSGTIYRTKKIEHVISEIEFLGAREYFFVDDNIACNPEYSRALFQALKGRGIVWMSQISTTVLRHPELIKLAGQSGCFYLFIGLESLNSASLSGAKKTFNKIEEYVELITLMRQNNIVPFLSFIFGFDEDGIDQFRYTLEFVKKHKIGFAVFWILTPFPGTDLYAEMENNGRLIEKDWSLFDGTHTLFNPTFTNPAQLEESYWKFYNQFYSVRHLLMSSLKNIQTSNTPFQEFCRNIFYHSIYKYKVSQREHPFSGGIGRL